MSTSRPNGYTSYRGISRETRPSSAELVDLHVYIVPPEIWRERYNNFLNQNVTETISAGIIRVHPERFVSDLRNELEQQVGEDMLPRDYVFLKSVGRSITRLKQKQEYQLKAKHFIPPQAYAPELYLLEISPDDQGSSRTSTRPHSPFSQNHESEDERRSGNKSKHRHNDSSPYRYSPLPKIKSGHSPTHNKGEYNHNGDIRTENGQLSDSWGSNSRDKRTPPPPQNVPRTPSHPKASRDQTPRERTSQEESHRAPPPRSSPTPTDHRKRADQSREPVSGTYTNHTNEDSGINVNSPEDHFDALDRRKLDEDRNNDLNRRLHPDNEDDHHRNGDLNDDEWEQRQREEEERRRRESEERRMKEDEDRRKEEEKRRRLEEERERISKQQLTGSDEEDSLSPENTPTPSNEGPRMPVPARQYQENPSSAFTDNSLNFHKGGNRNQANQNFAGYDEQNSRYKNSAEQNSYYKNSAEQNSQYQNSTEQNSYYKNSTEQNSQYRYKDNTEQNSQYSSDSVYSQESRMKVPLKDSAYPQGSRMKVPMKANEGPVNPNNRESNDRSRAPQESENSMNYGSERLKVPEMAARNQTKDTPLSLYDEPYVNNIQNQGNKSILKDSNVVVQINDEIHGKLTPRVIVHVNSGSSNRTVEEESYRRSRLKVGDTGYNSDWDSRSYRSDGYLSDASVQRNRPPVNDKTFVSSDERSRAQSKTDRQSAASRAENANQNGYKTERRKSILSRENSRDGRKSDRRSSLKKDDTFDEDGSRNERTSAERSRGRKEVSWSDGHKENDKDGTSSKDKAGSSNQNQDDQKAPPTIVTQPASSEASQRPPKYNPVHGTDDPPLNSVTEEVHSGSSHPNHRLNGSASLDARSKIGTESSFEKSEADTMISNVNSGYQGDVSDIGPDEKTEYRKKNLKV